VVRFGDASEVMVREQVARAMLNMGVRLTKLGQPARAVEVYDQVVTKFGDSVEAELREQVATARRMKARLEGGLEGGNA